MKDYWNDTFFIDKTHLLDFQITPFFHVPTPTTAKFHSMNELTAVLDEDSTRQQEKKKVCLSGFRDVKMLRGIPHVVGFPKYLF